MTMDTAGKAVLFSGLTVLISLSAVMLVPSPAFRSTSLGIMLSVVFVLAATLTLLPAVLAKLGPRVDRFALKWVHSGEHRSPRFAAWAERLWRRPLPYGLAALVLLVALALPVLVAEDRHAVDQGRAGRRRLARGLRRRCSRRSARVRRARCRSSRRGAEAGAVAAAARPIRASRRSCRRQPGEAAWRWCRRSRRRTRRRRPRARRSTVFARRCRRRRSSAARWPRTTTSRRRCRPRRRW